MESKQKRIEREHRQELICDIEDGLLLLHEDTRPLFAVLQALGIKCDASVKGGKTINCWCGRCF